MSGALKRVLGSKLQLSILTIFIFLMSVQPVFAQVAQTGQTTSYYPGDDGATQAGIHWTDPRFTIGNSVISDNFTGLMWVQDGSSPNFAGCTGGRRDWQGVHNYVSCLNSLYYLGYNDWRVPNAVELESLMNASQDNQAAWLASQGFVNMPVIINGIYWSSTTNAANTTTAVEVNLNDGSIDNFSKSLYLYALPVRYSGLQHDLILWKTGQTVSYVSGDDGAVQAGSDWPSNRFTDNGDQTVYDNLSELIWTKDAKSPGPAQCNPAVSKNWQSALDFIGCLNANNYLGYSDWRLPNRRELLSLIDRSTNGLPSGHPFINVLSLGWWSSTTQATYTNYAWLTNFSWSNLLIKTNSINNYVWPVREYIPNTLTVTKSGLGTGTVTSSPAGISCGADCSETYNYNMVVNLTAASDTGSTFTGWSGACSGTGVCSVTMDAAKSVSATFTLNIYALSVSKDGNGAGYLYSTPSGIDCGSDCAESYNADTEVVLHATPVAGSSLTGWTGCDDYDIPSGTCALVMTASRTVTATFILNTYTLTVSKSGTGSGTVLSAPPGISCGADCSETYNYNTVVDMTAASDAGSTFTGWSGSCSGTGICTVTMDAAKSVTAAFDLLPSITVTVPNGGESWKRGTTQTIRWTYSGNPGSTVKIELLKGGVLNKTITSGTSIGSSGSGSYNWAIPNNQAAGTNYTIKITSTSNSTYTDTSNGNFTISK